MDKNTLRKGKIMRLLLIAAVLLYSGAGLRGQSYLKKLGNGLSTGVNCSCVDSLGNIYTVTNKTYDTAEVNKWNVSTQSWSLYARLPNFQTYYFRATCSILYGKFYLTGDNLQSGKVEMMEYSGTWKKITTFYNTNWYTLNSIVFKNRIYIVGGFDSMEGAAYRNLVTYNGSVFSTSGFPSSYLSGGKFSSSFEIVADSLFMTCREKIIKHTAPNTWSTYYTGKAGQWFESIAAHNGMLYANVGREMSIVKGGSRIDSLYVLNSNYLHLKSCKNKLFLAEKYGQTNNVYVISNRKDIKFLFRNEVNDTGDFPLIANSSQLFYKGRDGVIVNGTNYNKIMEVVVDSITLVGFDTIRGFVFWDRNNNYIKDGNDVVPGSGYMQNVTYNTISYLGNNRGTFEEIVLENSDVEYNTYYTVFDSCVTFKHTGNVKSRNTDTGITIDSLYFPMVRPSTSNLNLVLKNQSRAVARLVDTIPLTVNIKNRDCYYASTNNGSVTVTLDTNTTFISSTPAYTTKNGNVITFTNLKFNYGTDNQIKLNVVYPNTKYSIGNIVRHRARMSNISGEDTLDNLDSIIQKMVYSYDPNAKHSVPEGRITKDLKNVRYYIDFQNLGNDDAVRVTVVDTLNLKIPVYEFQMVACSHPYKVSITPGTNVVTWVFNNINLPPKSKNEPGSKGYIIFDAKLKTNVKIGDSIRNRAYIYFDYNSPVITNYAVINRVDPDNNIHQTRVIKPQSFKAYPNPAHHFINLENTTLKIQNMMIYDMKGAVIMELKLNGNENRKLDTGNWSAGMYIICNDKGENLKFVVE